MVHQSHGKIFLASERGHTETEVFRSYNTFKFGNYQNENKIPFASLYLLNDDTLAGGQSLKLFIEEDSEILLLPFVGAIRYKDSLGNSSLIQAGQVQMTFLKKGATFEIANPYEKQLVNFFQFWFKSSVASSINRIIPFEIDKNKSSLFELPLHVQNTSPKSLKFSLGKFMGREEVVYKSLDKKRSAFVFVLQGAFEVQYRLLEARDGLALWNTEEIEIEALSNEAIIMLIEMNLE